MIPVKKMNAFPEVEKINLGHQLMLSHMWLARLMTSGKMPALRLTVKRFSFSFIILA